MNASRAAARGRLLASAACALSLASLAPPLAAQAESPLPCPATLEPSAAPSSASESRAHPAAARVLLLELGPTLSRALLTALDPWGLRVVEGRASNPGPSMPSSALAAQRIARQCAARAVVWLARDADGFALWVYDAESDRSLARPAPAPPFDASAAAALALSVKTVLRLVGLAPQPASAPAPTPREPGSSTPPSAKPPDGAAAEADRAAWQVGAHAGVRFGPFGVREPDARYGALVHWSPWAAAGGTRPWVGLAFEAGSAHRVHGPRFDGQVWDPAAELDLGVTQALTPWLALGSSVAAALHVSMLSGVARELASVEDTRFNPTLRAGGELQLELGRPVLALRTGAELWLRSQRYLVQKTSVLESRRASVQLSLAVQLPLD
jgi:hypothetical protein